MDHIASVYRRMGSSVVAGRLLQTLESLTMRIATLLITTAIIGGVTGSTAKAQTGSQASGAATTVKAQAGSQASGRDDGEGSDREPIRRRDDGEGSGREPSILLHESPADPRPDFAEGDRSRSNGSETLVGTTRSPQALARRGSRRCGFRRADDRNQYLRPERSIGASGPSLSRHAWQRPGVESLEHFTFGLHTRNHTNPDAQRGECLGPSLRQLGLV